MRTLTRSKCRRTAFRLSSYFPAAALFLFAVAIAPVVHGVEVYKWVDSAGRVHYGDRADAAPGGNKMDIDAATPPPDPQQAEHEARSRRLLNDIELDRRNAQTREAKQQAKEKKRKQRCASARKRLDKYEHAGFLYQKDKNGNRRILTDAEYDKAMAQARRNVTSACGPPSAVH